jgi:peptidoglycan/xylan/chitin deacetylase (PgdA/CDA1 family)
VLTSCAGFDDGITESYKFVVSRHVGGTNAFGGRASRGIPTLPLMDWSDLEHLVARGVAVECHTRSHPALTRVSSGEADDELLGCLDDLQARLGVCGAHVAYPYGDVNGAVASRAARYLRFGHTTDFRMLKTADASMRLPRLDTYYFQAPGALEAWGTPAFGRRIAWCRARRSIRARFVGGWSPRLVAAT